MVTTTNEAETKHNTYIKGGKSQLSSSSFFIHNQ